MRFPGIELFPDVFYVEQDDELTSAGTAARLDVCLRMLRARLGATEAIRVARRRAVASRRDGSQAQVIERPTSRAPAGALRCSTQCGIACTRRTVSTRSHGKRTSAGEAFRGTSRRWICVA